MTERLMLAQISADIRGLERVMQKSGYLVDNTARRMERDWQRSTRQMTRETELFGQNARRIIASIGIAAAISEIGDYADAWTRAENQLASAAVQTGRSAASMSVIADVARDTRTELEATTTLYARLERATAALGVTQNQTVAATRLINQAFVAGGASAEEQRSAILQLSQALQSGVLQGEELRSLRESAPLIMQAIAKEFGVAQGALKALGAEGKLTADRVFGAILGAAPEIESQFAATRSTVGDAITNVRTSVAEYIGTADKAIGASAGIAGAINSLADNFDVFGDTLLIAVTLLGARGLGGALNSAAGRAYGFASTYRAMNEENVRGLKDASDAADRALHRTLSGHEREQRSLAELENKRAAAYLSNSSNADFVSEAKALAKAEKNHADALENLTKVSKANKVESYGLFNARAALTEAEKELNGVREKASPQLKQIMQLDGQIANQTVKAEKARNSYNKAIDATRIASTRLQAATSGLSRGMGSLVNFLGGPVGIAFMAVGAAVAYFNHEATKAQRATQSMNDALSILANQTIDTADAKNLSAEASEALTKRLEAQKKATAALAEVERQRTKQSLNEAYIASKRTLKKIERDIKLMEKPGVIPGLLGHEVDQEKLSQNPRYQQLVALQKEQQELQAILVDGYRALKAVDFDTGSTETKIESGAGVTGDKDELSAINDIDAAYREMFESRADAAKRSLNEQLAAIEKAKLSDVDALEKRKNAQAIYAATMGELYKEAEDAAAAKAAADAEAAAKEIDIVADIVRARQYALGQFHSIMAAEFADRRAHINATIKDEARRLAALAALSQEEAEIRRRASEESLGIGEGDSAGSEIERLRQIEAEKLSLLTDALENELITRQEYADRRLEIERQTEAEAQAIRGASAAMQFSAAASMFGGLLQLAEAFGTKNKTILKGLFLAEKAAALASAYVNMNLAIAKAAASAPPPFNAPAIAAAKMTGVATIAGIAAQTVAGFRTGGYTGDKREDEVAGVVHGKEFVMTAAATRRIGKKNLEALQAGRPLPSGVLSQPNATASAAAITIGDMNLSVSGPVGQSELDDIREALAKHGRQIEGAISGFGRQFDHETKRKTARHER